MLVVGGPHLVDHVRHVHGAVEHDAAPHGPFALHDALTVLATVSHKAYLEVPPAARGMHRISAVVARGTVKVLALFLSLRFTGLDGLSFLELVAGGVPQCVQVVIPKKGVRSPDPALRPGSKSSA